MNDDENSGFSYGLFINPTWFGGAVVFFFWFCFLVEVLFFNLTCLWKAELSWQHQLTVITAQSTAP